MVLNYLIRNHSPGENIYLSVFSPSLTYMYIHHRSRKERQKTAETQGADRERDLETLNSHIKKHYVPKPGL